MKISIIVPAFNEEKLIGQTLATIRRAAAVFAELGWEFELVVCDNNSNDRTAEIAREHGAIVVFERLNQIGRARNSGARAASGDWFIFIDADSAPNPDLFRAVAREIESGICVGGGATIRPDQPILIASLLIQFWNLVSRLKRWAAGSFIFCDASVFRQIGGFDKELFVSEEIEFSNRLKAFARAQRRKVTIISSSPLVTSVRKFHLYSGLEHTRFLLKAALRPSAILRKREACTIWYDGRR